MPFTMLKRHPLVMPMCILAAGLLLQFLFSWAYVTSAIVNSETRWCSLLGDIVQAPAPKFAPFPGPAATEQQRMAYRSYRIYTDLKALREESQCRS